MPGDKSSEMKLFLECLSEHTPPYKSLGTAAMWGKFGSPRSKIKSLSSAGFEPKTSAPREEFIVSYCMEYI